MASKFAIAQTYWPDIALAGTVAEAYLPVDPIVSVLRCGLVAERTATVLCAAEGIALPAHADHSQIVDFVKGCDPDNVIIMHSENREAFLDDLSDYNVILPQTGEEFELDV